MKDLQCPYCGHEQDVCHDDGFGYSEDELHQMECYVCGKNFIFSTVIIFNYYPDKADCLNDGKHNYQLTATHPKEFSKMRCSMCGEKREMTEGERLSFSIGTKQEYFDKLSKNKHLPF